MSSGLASHPFLRQTLTHLRPVCIQSLLYQSPNLCSMQELFTTTTLKSLSSLNSTAKNTCGKKQREKKMSLSAQFYTQTDGNNKVTISFINLCDTIAVSAAYPYNLKLHIYSVLGLTSRKLYKKKWTFLDFLWCLHLCKLMTVKLAASPRVKNRLIT